MGEVVKLPICILAAAWVTRSQGGLFKLVRAEVIGNPISTFKCAVPALCYTIQGNLLFTALQHLEAPTFQANCYHYTLLQSCTERFT